MKCVSKLMDILESIEELHTRISHKGLKTFVREFNIGKVKLVVMPMNKKIYTRMMTYNELRKNKICVRCRTNKSLKGKVFCEECKKENNEKNLAKKVKKVTSSMDLRSPAILKNEWKRENKRSKTSKRRIKR